VLAAELAEGVMTRATSESERTFHQNLLQRSRDAARPASAPTSQRP